MQNSPTIRTGHFDNIDSSVINSSVCWLLEAVQDFLIALYTRAGNLNCSLNTDDNGKLYKKSALFSNIELINFCLLPQPPTSIYGNQHIATLHKPNLTYIEILTNTYIEIGLLTRR